MASQHILILGRGSVYRCIYEGLVTHQKQVGAPVQLSRKELSQKGFKERTQASKRFPFRAALACAMSTLAPLRRRGLRCRNEDAQAEASILEERVKQLKAEVAEAATACRESGEEAQLASQAKWFNVLDSDCSGGIGEQDLQRNLQKVPGCERADPQWAREILVRLDNDRDGELGALEFDLEELRRTVRYLELEERERSKEQSRSLETLRDNVAMISLRVLACLPYLLPVLTHLDAPATGEGVMLSTWSENYPVLALGVVTLQDLDSVLFQSWWARILAFNFLLISIWASQLPQLLRFNALQAAILYVIFYLPRTTALLLQALENDPGSYFDNGPAVFGLLLFCVAYALLWTLGGRLPDGIPVVSGIAREGTRY